MRYIKSYKKFQENAVATASSTAGPGPVVSATVGSLPGVGAMDGSGDLSFYLRTKRKSKKGNPSQVTDMRDLAPAKGVTKVEDIKESEMTIRPRDPAYDPETRKMIDNCLVELYDLDFELGLMDYDKQRLSVDLDEEETGYFSQEELRISLHKNIKEVWTGNITTNCKFDEGGVISTDISTLRPRGKSLNEFEQSLFDLVEEVSQKLIGNLYYQKGSFRIGWEVAGSAMPYNSERNISVNVHFTLENNLKE
jgi:hypothetical protein